MTALRVLIAEDVPEDAELLVRQLGKAGYEPQWVRVETEPDFLKALEDQPDIIFSDYAMPRFSGMRALELLRDSGRDIPLILISGTVGEEVAVEAMRFGATDYFLKDRTVRLGSAVERALREFRLRRERRKVEGALHGSEQRLRSIIETSPECVKVIAPDGQVLEMNSAGLAMLEVGSLAELQTHPLLDFVAPEDHAAFVDLHRRVLRGETGELEFSIIGRHGARRIVATHAGPLRNAAGGVDALLGITRDITQRRRNEELLRISNERFQAVVQATNDAVRDWDPRSGKVWWSEGLQAQFGLSPADAEVGIDAWRGRIHPEDRPRVLASLDRALQSGTSQWLARYRFMRSDGSYVMVSDRGQIIRDAAGSAVRFLGGMRDVTDLQALEEQLRQSQRLEALGQLTGGVAHDFNNLLTVMLGNAEVLQEQLADDPRRQGLAQMIASAAQRAADLTQRLLAFARRQALSPESVDIKALIFHMEPLLRRTIAESIDIAITPAPRVWNALIDASQLESALLNLCINARDAMPQGGRLTIDARNVVLDNEYAARHPDVTPGQYVLIAVTDTGVGIPAELMPRLFEPFFTTKEVGKGTGLGLAMVYGFVKQSGGHISVYSEVGHGTTVRMYLPRNAEDGPTASLPVIDLSTPGGSETILLVEDDMLVRGVVAETLQSFGYSVLLAGNGPEALEILQRGDHVDLLFTDVMMPGMTGRQLVDAASRLRPELKVLYCSGYSEDAIMHQGRLDKGVNLLAKPFRRGELARRVREVLDGS